MSGEGASLAEKIIIIWIGPHESVPDYSWNAPPLVKASFAFEIIWFLASLFQALIGTALYSLPAETRRPYFILLSATLATILYYLMAAIGTGLQGRVHTVITDRITVVTSIFYILAAVLQPAAALSLARQLGHKLQTTRSRVNGPIISRPWKRTLDWTLVGVALIMYIAALANNASYVAAGRTATPTASQAEHYARTSQALGYTSMALVVLLSLDVVISSISLLVVAKRARWTDRALGPIRYVVVPFSIAYASQWLIIYTYLAIVPSTSTSYDALAAEFSRIMVEGFSRIFITFGLLFTMDLPKVPPKPSETPRTRRQQTTATTMQQKPVQQPSRPTPTSYARSGLPSNVRTIADYR
ncbi:hypothetical protein M408DRAFT_18986 [Serendipita vermifera MAFF 305830]|uniref:Uncharacterized protein n=1 Tax=Serendipita vermifera MAFF 305830 TaxID=933852 RepID=A0A0C3BPK5_SERVB|nr:hypothetical protein M408DRAFT_18986 [Serendipita vermifera MAFF 305830]